MPRAGNFPYNTPELRLQRFVIGVAQGLAPGDSYIEAGYNPKSRRVAVACASRMLARDDVQQRLHQLRKMVQADSLLSIHEKRRFLKKVVMTPVAEVDEADPLCGKVTRNTRTTGQSTVEKVTVQMPDKLRALELDAKLAGELVGGVPQTASEAAPPHADEQIQARLATVLGMIMSAGKPLLRPVCPPSTEGANEPEAVADLPSSRLTEISLLLARQMTRAATDSRR
jgi:hypothetical protein